MKRVAVFALLTLALLASLGALSLSLSCRKTEATNLATKFPAKTQLFVQVVHLGQWMELPSGTEAAASPQSAGRDPLLQVLGQVWAAETLQPKDLPVLLKDQPFAVGIWKQGENWEGVALLPLGQGHRSALEPFLVEKLSGEPAGERAGLSFRKSVAVAHEHISLFWAVGDDRAVFATSLDAAGAVLVPATATLDGVPAFKRATKVMPSDRGACLFLSGELMKSLAEEKGADSLCRLFTPSAEVKPPAPPSPPPPPETPDEPKAQDIPEQGPALVTPPAETDLGALAAPTLESAKKFFDPESLAALAVWTSPPSPTESQWEAKACLAYADAPKGFWKMAAGLDTVRPSLSGRVPRDGDNYVWAGGFDAAQHYRCLMEEAEKTLPQSQMSTLRGGLGFVEGKLGLSLANDLLPTLGDEALIVQQGSDNEQRWVVALSLKDSRRFESLMTGKVAPSLSLEALSFPGARGWKYSGVTLLVSGGVALFTNEAQWALSSGKEQSKAWKRLDETSASVSGILSFSHEGATGFPAYASWQLSPEGIILEAQVPGKPFKIPLPETGDSATQRKSAI